jgi:ribonuclease HI
LTGRKPGIYTQWGGSDGAEAQVKGFPGAVFRGFATQQEAVYYQRTGGKLLPVEKTSAESSSVSGAPAPRQPLDYNPDLAAGKVVIFTDGASTGNPGPGGYGVVMLFGDPAAGDVTRRELSGGFRCTTNNRMELLACIAALNTLKRPSDAVIYSDSRYVVNAVTLGWARRWQSNGWLRAAGDNGERERAENVDLWQQMLALLDRHRVEFRWVKGHANHPENERCDRLAVQAARQRNLPLDPGYDCK